MRFPTMFPFAFSGRVFRSPEDDPGTAPPAAPPAAPPPTSTHSSEPPRTREADLRAEAAAYRIQVRTLEEQKTALEGKLQEATGAAERRVQEEVGKVTQKLTKAQDKYVSSELKAAAVAAGLQDVDLLPLIERGDVKIDDDWNVTGVDEAIEKMKAKKPDWFKKAAATTGGGEGAGGGTGAGGGERTQRPPPRSTGNPSAPPATPPAQKAVKDMTKAEYADWKRGARSRLRSAAR